MRVIQDSDDEFDDLEANDPPPKQADPPDQQLAPSQSGMGSTESLKREVQKVHHDCLQSRDNHNGVEPPRHVSEPPGKRRKTSAEGTPAVDLLEAGLNDGLAFTEACWNLEGTIRDNYAIHDPMTMFPEPSSTVPNATLTQQRMMEEVMAPAMLGGGLDHEAPRYQPEDSVPWSDMIKFSPLTPIEQVASPSRGQIPGALPASSNRQRTTQEPVSEAIPISLQTQEEAIRPSSLYKKQNISTMDSEDDLADISLPKGQYKPRPSRSRSLKASMEQLVDHSIWPEKAVRASKGRNAKGSRRNTSILTTPQKIQQICNMGFTPSTTQRALAQNNDDVTQTVDWLISNGIGEDELAPHGTPIKRMATKESIGSPSVNKEVESDKVQNVLDEPTEPHEHVVSIPACPTVQVVIGQTPPKRRKTALDKPESEPLSDLRDQVVPVVASEKKRGRGRPKKVVSTTVTTTGEAVVQTPRGKISAELHGVAPEPTVPIPKSSPRPEPQHHEDKASDKTPPIPVIAREPSHSSTKGKVPFRVGLSKRAKIAPLLRTLKK